MGLAPGDGMDVGSADADVGKFPVAQTRKLVQASVVAPPVADESDDCSEHFEPLLLSSGTCAGQSNWHVHRALCCGAKAILLRRSYAENAYLCHLIVNNKSSRRRFPAQEKSFEASESAWLVVVRPMPQKQGCLCRNRAQIV